MTTLTHEMAPSGLAIGPDLSPLPVDAHLLAPVIRWAREDPDHPLASVRAGDAFVEVAAAAT